MTDTVKMRFAPNQPVPLNYTIEWWSSDEMYRWVHEPSRHRGEPETYGDAHCCRFRARRDAWEHFRKHEGDDK